MKRPTLVAAAVFAALLVVAAVLLAQPAERGITRLSLGDVPKDRIDRVVFAGKDAAELRKDGAGWRLATGKLADGAAVGRMLDALARMKSSDLLTKDAGRFAEYEVDDAKGTRLTAFAGSSKVAEIVVGKNVPGGLVVRSDGAAFKVSGTSQAMLVRAPGAWIEHKLFDDKVEDATRLEVKLAGAAPWTLVKKDGAWAVEDPKLLPAGFRFDADAARSLVASVAALRAKDFEEKDPGSEATGLGDGADTLAITFAPTPPRAEEAKDGAKEAAKADAPAPAPVVRVVRLGKAKGEGKDQAVYARIDGRDDVFTLYDGTAKGLRKAPADLRDLRVMSFEPQAAQRLTISDGKVALAFEKKNGVWELAKSAEAKPEGFELDPAAVERRVATVAATRAQRVAEPKDGTGGLEAPAARISVGLEGGRTATLALGRETKDGDREVVFAKGNADGASYLLPKWTRQSLTAGIASFEKKPEGGMPNIDPKALSNLPPDVRESLIKQLVQKQREQQMLQQISKQAPRAPRPPPPPAK